MIRVFCKALAWSRGPVTVERWKYHARDAWWTFYGAFVAVLVLNRPFARLAESLALQVTVALVTVLLAVVLAYTAWRAGRAVRGWLARRRGQ